jgi:hypothetical protein
MILRKHAGFIHPSRTAFPALTLPSALSNIDGIAAGAGGTIWITGTGTGTIVRFTLPARR